jgi:hypothetical protein
MVLIELECVPMLDLLSPAMRAKCPSGVCAESVIDAKQLEVPTVL